MQELLLGQLEQEPLVMQELLLERELLLLGQLVREPLLMQEQLERELHLRQVGLQE